MTKEPAAYLPYRLEVTGMLNAESVYHIGTGERWDPATDAPILRGPGDLPYLPGASLRGIIRAYLNREHCLLGCDRQSFERLFGKSSEFRQDGRESVTSRLRVEDAWLSGEAAASEIRDHVRIDHQYGSAADKAKFDQEVAGKGAKFSFRLIYEGQTKDDDELLLIAEAIRQLEQGSLRVGAKSGWGLGCVRLSDVQYLEFDRSSDDGLARYLAWRAGGDVSREDLWAPPHRKEALGLGTAVPFNILDFNLMLRFEGPVLVKAAIPPTMPEGYTVDGTMINDPKRYAELGMLVADHVFLSDRGGRYYLPGSSLRGVLRAEAGWICQTALGSCNLEDCLFGTAKGSGDDAVGQKGRIEISDGNLAGDALPVYLDHVAIDRITNAAADGQKFSTCSLDSPKFVVRVRLRYEHGEEALAALWILLLRALESGQLWAGSGVTRGYGYIAGASSGLVRCSFVTAEVRHEEKLTLDELADRFQSAWEHARQEAA